MGMVKTAGLAVAAAAVEVVEVAEVVVAEDGGSTQGERGGLYDGHQQKEGQDQALAREEEEEGEPERPATWAGMMAVVAVVAGAASVRVIVVTEVIMMQWTSEEE